MATVSDKKLDQILEKLEAMAVVQQQINDLITTTNKHSLVLYGNGQPGLKSDVELLKDSQRRTNALALILSGFMVTEIGGLLFAILTHSIELVQK